MSQENAFCLSTRQTFSTNLLTGKLGNLFASMLTSTGVFAQHLYDICFPTINQANFSACVYYRQHKTSNVVPVVTTPRRCKHLRQHRLEAEL